MATSPRSHTELNGSLLNEDGAKGSHGEPSRSPAASSPLRKLYIASIFVFFFMAAEVMGGYLANSLAIMTDAAHLFSDLVSFGVGILSVVIARKPASKAMTFGYARLELVGALFSIFLIWVTTGILCYEAVLRILHPEHVDGRIMFITACGALLVNLALLRVLHSGPGHSHGHDHIHGHSHGHSHGSNVNDAGDQAQSMAVRAAFIHALGDLFQSIGVMLAAALIWWKPSLRIADPICTFLFSILVLITTVNVLRDTLGVLVNSTPQGLDLSSLHAELCMLPSVKRVHDLHVWSITNGVTALTVHLLITDPSEWEDTLRRAQHVCSGHGIKHATIQIERSGGPSAELCRHAVNSCKMRDLDSPSAFRSPGPAERRLKVAEDEAAEAAMEGGNEYAAL